MNRFNVRKVAVLGAGVMGAQIAAHLVNVKVPVVLFDLPAKEGPKNGIVTKAVEGLKKLKPAPLGVPEDAALIEQANYEEHLDQLQECDLDHRGDRRAHGLEARPLQARSRRPIAPHAIVASNTSGLSITKLSEVLPEEIKPRFCGIHFFNPPRYMALVELIPTPTTRARDPRPARGLRDHARSASAVVRAKDTPNFIANRVGIAGMLATMKEAETFGLTLRRRRRPDRQEARPRQLGHLPHRRRGRPRHDGARHQDAAGQPAGRPVLRDATRRRRCSRKLIEQGALGQKSGAGFYKKVGKDILRLDPAKGDYVPAGGKADEIVARILKKPPAERLKLLRESKQPAGAVPVGDPARQLPLRGGAPGRHRRERARHRLRDALGLRHQPGPVRAVAGRPAGSRSRSGSRTTSMPARRCSKAPLPAWVFDGPVADDARRAPPEGSWSAAQRASSPPQHAAGLPAPAVPRERGRRRRAGAAEGRHRGVQERRGARLDARRRGADREHHRQAAPDQPGGDRRPAEGGRARRGDVQGPRDLVARRRVLGRRQPRGADAGVHEERRQGHRARGEEAAGR